MSVEDKLDKILKAQAELQDKYGIKFPISDEAELQKYINENSLHLIMEVTEALNETKCKSWKKNQELNYEKFKEELIDCWHFLINLTLASGMDSGELLDKYLLKNGVNRDRITNGY